MSDEKSANGDALIVNRLVWCLPEINDSFLQMNLIDEFKTFGRNYMIAESYRKFELTGFDCATNIQLLISQYRDIMENLYFPSHQHVTNFHPIVPIMKQPYEEF